MKTRLHTLAKILAVVVIANFGAGNTCSQLQADGTYLAADAATAAVINKNPKVTPTLQLVVTDWNKFQTGKLQSADEATLLQNIVVATAGKLTPVEASTLNAAMSIVIANQSNPAPSPLTGGAATAIQDVINGIQAAITFAQAATATGS